jgi:hypothetical protein
MTGAMRGFSIRLELHEFESRLAALKRPGVPLARAINKSMHSGRSAMKRLIAEDLGLKVGDVDKFLSVREATSSKLEATLYASAKRVPLILFDARGPEPSRGLGTGVTARLKGGAGTYPHAFIATMKSGHRGVFKRRGTPRLPIDQLHGPSIFKAFQKHEAAAVARTQEQLAKNVPHEIEFEFARG